MHLARYLIAVRNISKCNFSVLICYFSMKIYFVLWIPSSKTILDKHYFSWIYLCQHWHKILPQHRSVYILPQNLQQLFAIKLLLFHSQRKANISAILQFHWKYFKRKSNIKPTLIFYWKHLSKCSIDTILDTNISKIGLLLEN